MAIWVFCTLMQVPRLRGKSLTEPIFVSVSVMLMVMIDWFKNAAGWWDLDGSYLVRFVKSGWADLIAKLYKFYGFVGLVSI